MSDTAVAVPLVRPLEHGRMKPEAHVRRQWFATVSDMTSQEEIFDPGFWKHVVFQTQPHPLDKVSITNDAQTFYLETLVVGVDRDKLYSQKVSEISLLPTPALDDAGLHVKWTGPHSKWMVFRGERAVGGSHATRSAAEQSLAGHAGGAS